MRPSFFSPAPKSIFFLFQLLTTVLRRAALRSWKKKNRGRGSRILSSISRRCIVAASAGPSQLLQEEADLAPQPWATGWWQEPCYERGLSSLRATPTAISAMRFNLDLSIKENSDVVALGRSSIVCAFINARQSVASVTTAQQISPSSRSLFPACIIIIQAHYPVHIHGTVYFNCIGQSLSRDGQ